jgi:hypothetical protein
MLAPLVLQLLLPLALLAWLAFAPAGSLLAWVLQALGVGTFLVALGLVGLWTLPPWWTPWLYGALWCAAVIATLLRRGLPTPALPGNGGAWLTAGSGLLLLATALWQGGVALAGRVVPEGPVVDLPNPLGPGRYLVGHGGSTTLVNAHQGILEAEDPRLRRWRGQALAIDLLGLDDDGRTRRGLRPEDPARYTIWGAPVHAPCAGRVVQRENGLPDQRVPERDWVRLPGNHVLLRCGDFEVLFAHLQRGSVRVAAGERVSPGTLLGVVGNSGNSSEPHLHLHAQRPGPPDAPFAGDPLPLRIDGRWLVRNDRIEGRAWSARKD